MEKRESEEGESGNTWQRCLSNFTSRYGTVVAPSLPCSQALVHVPRPEHAAPSAPPAPHLARPTETLSTTPQVALSTLLSAASRASLPNVAGMPSAPPQAETDKQAAKIREHSATDGWLGEPADNTPQVLEAGLHVIFDSARDSQPLRVAEIEYVLCPQPSNHANKPFY